MTFVVEVVQQAGGAVEIDEVRDVFADEAELPGLLLAVGADTAFDGERVLEQAGALGELGEQRPCGVAGWYGMRDGRGCGRRQMGRYLVSHIVFRFGVRREYHRYLRVSCGLFLQSHGFPLEFHLT